jgi:hypothetical protein
MISQTSRVLDPTAKDQDNNSRTALKPWQLFTAQRWLRRGVEFPSIAEGDAARQEMERMLLRRI